MTVLLRCFSPSKPTAVLLPLPTVPFLPLLFHRPLRPRSSRLFNLLPTSTWLCRRRSLYGSGKHLPSSSDLSFPLFYHSFLPISISAPFSSFLPFFLASILPPSTHLSYLQLPPTSSLAFLPSVNQQAAQFYSRIPLVLRSVDRSVRLKMPASFRRVCQSVSSNFTDTFTRGKSTR